jgi:bifunctional UDP-N-acetylglucosamine pyrophosphorylase/glucosamine-1-phosphate N-acetyltransferase
MAQLAAIILAAGKGTRMKSSQVKVMHELCGRPMVDFVVQSAREAGAGQLVLVTGHQSESVRDYFASDKDICCALQEEQLGTGHAVACGLPLLDGFAGDVLILCGDAPLVRGETLRQLATEHRDSGAAVTVLTALMDTPTGYGRIVRSADGGIDRIVEEKDASAEERAIAEINSGIYCVAADFLAVAVAGLSNDNAQGEYYLTDIISAATSQGLACRPLALADAEEISGVNDRVQLAAAAAVVRRRISEGLMLSGVTIVDPASTYIDAGVVIGADSVIHPNSHIRGATAIGSGCSIGPSAVIDDCTIHDHVTVKAGSVMTESLVHNHVAIGPMAHLRPGTVLHPHVKIGNFVETKKAVMGEGSKASHLTYLGDAEIGADVNIGCGTITCNYDGEKKHRTVIEDGAFIGSDVQLVAPVTVGRNSLIAAGTTVTKDVPADSLAIARVPQVNKVRKNKGLEQGAGHKAQD